MTGALILAAAITCTSPQGQTLTLLDPWRYSELQKFALEHLPQSSGQAFRIAAASQVSHSWFRIGAAWDSTVVWPKGQTVVLTLKDGSRIKASTLLAVGVQPESRPIYLGLNYRSLDPSELEHERGHKVFLLAAFDGDVALRDVAGIEVMR